MSLISCPHCQKKVSDTVSTCIHCGAALVQENQPVLQEECKPTFADLPTEEQQALEKEFLESNGECKRFYQQRNFGPDIWKLSTWCMLCLVLEMFVTTYKSMVYHESMIEMVSACTSIMLVVLLVAVVSKVLVISRQNRKKKVLVYLKKLQFWLRENKGILYELPPFCAAEDQMYFADLDPNTKLL